MNNKFQFNANQAPQQTPQPAFSFVPTQANGTTAPPSNTGFNVQSN
jgi:hypothetical protein